MSKLYKIVPQFVKLPEIQVLDSGSTSRPRNCKSKNCVGDGYKTDPTHPFCSYCVLHYLAYRYAFMGVC